jgi:hypothetical protein
VYPLLYWPLYSCCCCISRSATVYLPRYISDCMSTTVYLPQMFYLCHHVFAALYLNWLSYIYYGLSAMVYLPQYIYHCVYASVYLPWCILCCVFGFAILYWPLY